MIGGIYLSSTIMGDMRRDTDSLVGRRRRPTEFRDGYNAPSVVRKVPTIVEPRAPHIVSLVLTHAVVLLKKKLNNTKRSKSNCSDSIVPCGQTHVREET